MLEFPADSFSESRVLKPAKLESLPAQWQEDLKRLCERELNDVTQAHEVADDVWHDYIMRYQNTLRESKAAWAYLRIACLRRCRRLRAQQRRFSDVSQQRLPDESTPENILIADTEEALQYQRLSACMEKLPMEWQEYLRFRFHLGLTVDGVGQQFRVSKQYAGRVLAKALAQLRLCVGKLS